MTIPRDPVPIEQIGSLKTRLLLSWKMPTGGAGDFSLNEAAWIVAPTLVSLR
jgi:hypothetical protein